MTETRSAIHTERLLKGHSRTLAQPAIVPEPKRGWRNDWPRAAAIKSGRRLRPKNLRYGRHA
jgi:hypothetical protein